MPILPHAKTAPNDSSTRRQWLIRLGLQCLALLATLLLGIVLLVVAERIGWLGATNNTGLDEGATDTAATIYTCPMHPEIRQDESGKCPICGMMLVPIEQSSPAKPKTAKGESDRYICPMMCTPPSSEPGKCPVCAMDLVKASSNSGGGERSVSIDAAARRIVGIRTAQAKESEVYRTLRTIGDIDYDEERVATIAAYVDGRLEKLEADYVGVKVAQGDSLAVLYSPQLYSAQVEYLSSRSTPALDALGGGGGTRLSKLALDKLKELGMSPSQIAELSTKGHAEKRLAIVSPIGGTVIAKHKVEGDYVKTGEPIYKVVDLSTVWLMLELYPSDAAAVRYGQEVEAEMQSLPGIIYTGRVAFIAPVVNKKTRTVSIRVEFTNVDGRLKPGDYATATIRVTAVPHEKVFDPALAGRWISPRHPQIIRNEPGKCPICGRNLIPTADLGYAEEPLPDQTVVNVPRSAVLMAGDNSVIYVETEPGLFEIRDVTLGPMTDDLAVILGGVDVDETVATDGNFLIDSQMQLGGKPSLMDPSRGSGSSDKAPAQEAHHAH